MKSWRLGHRELGVLVEGGHPESCRVKVGVERWARGVCGGTQKTQDGGRWGPTPGLKCQPGATALRRSRTSLCAVPSGPTPAQASEGGGAYLQKEAELHHSGSHCLSCSLLCISWGHPANLSHP